MYIQGMVAALPIVLLAMLIALAPDEAPVLHTRLTRRHDGNADDFLPHGSRRRISCQAPLVIIAQGRRLLRPSSDATHSRAGGTIGAGGRNTVMAMTTQDTRPVIDVSAATVATQLGETEPEPVRHITQTLRILGEERVHALVAEARAVEAAGGMMLGDGSRRRTLGGVFFYLARRSMNRKDAARVFGASGRQNGSVRPTRTDGPAAGASAAPAFAWATFGAAATEAMSSAGEATTVKLTVIGRPGKIVERGDVALVAMRSEKAPSLPKGVPAPPSPRTDYMVLVGMKQWRKVAQALAADPSDKLLIEGYPTVQPEFAGVTVYATSATTTGIQAGKRAAQTAPATSG